MLNRQADVLTQECVTLLVTLKSCPLQIRRDNFYSGNPPAALELDEPRNPNSSASCIVHLDRSVAPRRTRTL